MADFDIEDAVERLEVALKDLRNDNPVHLPYTLATVIELLLYQQERIAEYNARFLDFPYALNPNKKAPPKP
jgi:hypothetical protein